MDNILHLVLPSDHSIGPLCLKLFGLSGGKWKTYACVYPWLA